MTLVLENPYCVRATVADRLLARQGAMVAHRGELTLATHGQGVRKLLKRTVTGEGLALMEIAGRGEIWLADLAKNVLVLPGDGLSVAGKSVLCFEPTLGYEISRVKGAGMSGGGLFNSTFSGPGTVALTADGEPMTLAVAPGAPVFVDTDAVIGWTASLTTTVHRSESAKSFLKGGSGEAFQLKLEGEGTVLVQPSEGPILPKKDGIGDAVGELLGG